MSPYSAPNLRRELARAGPETLTPAGGQIHPPPGAGHDALPRLHGMNDSWALMKGAHQVASFQCMGERGEVGDRHFDAELRPLAATRPRRRRRRGGGPSGAKWTIALLADALVELKVFDSVSASTVQRGLNKMNSSPGA